MSYKKIAITCLVLSFIVYVLPEIYYAAKMKRFAAFDKECIRRTDEAKMLIRAGVETLRSEDDRKLLERCTEKMIEYLQKDFPKSTNASIENYATNIDFRVWLQLFAYTQRLGGDVTEVFSLLKKFPQVEDLDFSDVENRLPSEMVTAINE
ncbi:MAG: hypothetical protein ACRC37_01295, partial [Lentisphaeria bacterium]